MSDAQEPDGAAPAPPAELRLPALNRRGRSIEVRVTATPLRGSGEAPAGAIIVVEPEAPVLLPPSSFAGSVDG